jgi:putative acetyltransferase
MEVNHTHAMNIPNEMELEMILRKETAADIAAITEVTIAAFKNHPIGNPTEQFIINALREAEALTISLVAEMEGRVVGHIAFSPVTISDGTLDWYGLGPVSVLPEYQKQGIGKSLVNEGLALLKALGGQGCTLVGDPNYYQRFGFRNFPELVHEGVPPEAFLVLPFTETMPQGIVVFHEAFLANG